MIADQQAFMFIHDSNLWLLEAISKILDRVQWQGVTRFESLLLTPATILGTPAEALNQKNSTSLTLGTQTAFDFLRPASAGVFVPKCSMALAKTFQTL
jgi:hypothetical protein